MKGAMLRDVKNYEDMAVQAIFTARAQNEKRVNVKKLFNAEKVRKQILNNESQVAEEKDFTLFRKAKEAMKKYKIGG
ncbi:hypothetical protein D1606_11945 [Rummeliibacillus sp. POC4]|nr:hypothetical protein D1606_11945 [Rummeliibacillus sp. POC4]